MWKIVNASMAAALATLILWAPLPANAQAAALPSLAPLLGRISPAVVSILVQAGKEKTGGSGFIIDPAGYIVTNNHVVDDAKKITVVLSDGSRYPGKLIGHDDATDLALLKIDAKEQLVSVSWGDSDGARVGDWVVAIGNPLGFGGTVTVGVISALGRDMKEGPYDHFIQIDAPINHGSSGGPAFNLAGEVIGINTLIYSPSGGSIGLGFAIPSNIASGIIAELKDKGSVTHVWLGAKVQGITSTLAKIFGLDPVRPRGALVAHVFPDSPAVRAGIVQGDVIVGIDGHPIEAARDLPWRFVNASIGQTFDLAILRNGQQMSLAVTVSVRQQETVPITVSEDVGVEVEAADLGLLLSPTSPELRLKFHIPKDVDGVVVTHVADDSPASAAGFEPGDVLVAINRQPANKIPLEAVEQLSQAASAGDILLLVNREDKMFFVGLSVHPDTDTTGR